MLQQKIVDAWRPQVNRSIKHDHPSSSACVLFVLSDHVEVCRDLLAAGAFPDAEDKLGQTPLYVAVDSNKVGVATVLCEAGASTSRAGPHGRTPLHVAARDGLAECAKVLLLHGAPIDNNPDK